MKAAANEWTWLCFNKTLFTKTCMGQIGTWAVVYQFRFIPFTISDYPQPLASSLDSERGLHTHVIAPSQSQPRFLALRLQLGADALNLPPLPGAHFAFLLVYSMLSRVPFISAFPVFPSDSPLLLCLQILI